MQTIAVIGGAGYIGSHTVVELVRAGYTPIIIDNFSNSDESVLQRLNQVTGQRITCITQDFRDQSALQKVFTDHQVSGIIHFAAYKAVGESVEQPLKYYQNNVSGFVNLLQAAQECGIRSVVFSSSAAVYGNPPTSVVTEDSPTTPASPYGSTKLMDEVILRDYCAAQPDTTGVALRYFNAIGAHDSGLIGELPKGKPQNLLPIIMQTIVGQAPELTIYGDDYDTADGTCERDYIHVVDLATAHVAALQKAKVGFSAYNVGTGTPTSVLGLITAFQDVNQVNVPYRIGQRRAGDPVRYFADSSKIQQELGWHAQKTTQDAVRDAWAWQQNLQD